MSAGVRKFALKNFHCQHIYWYEILRIIELLMFYQYSSSDNLADKRFVPRAAYRLLISVMVVPVFLWHFVETLVSAGLRCCAWGIGIPGHSVFRLP